MAKAWTPLMPACVWAPRHPKSAAPTISLVLPPTGSGVKPGEHCRRSTGWAQTRQEGDEVGQQVVIEGGSSLHRKTNAARPRETSFTVKSFFNIPARRNFLKKRLQVEQKHSRRNRVRGHSAHRYPYYFQSNGNEILNLPTGSLMQTH